MSTTFKHGNFCWWELGTTDQPAGEQFYCDLFGWTADRNPMGPDMVYTTFRMDGKSVMAMYQKGPQDPQPVGWLSYILVDNVDEAAAKVGPAGGTVMMEPFDVMTFGRMAVIADPSGAVVGLWQANEHKGAELVNAVGGNCWNEMMTRDLAKAREFFAAVLGWTYQGMPMAQGGEYTLIKLAGEGDSMQSAGGMMQLDHNFPPEVPSHWMPYTAVTDCDASAAKATELGGAVVYPPTDIPDVGRFALLKDPQGAHFSVLQLLPME